MLKKVISEESGRTLVLALIVLGIGALLIPVFLSHASTNLLATRVTEEGLKEQYAADSGIEYALWQLQTGVFSGTTGPGYVMNSKEVNVTWGDCPGITDTYKITSTATTLVDGSSTTVESYVFLHLLDFDWLFDNAITSPGDVTIKPGTEVSGTVAYGGTLDNKGTITPLPEGPTQIEDWPGADDLSGFYLMQMEGAATVPDGYIIDISDYTEANPRSIWNGDSLDAAGYLEIKGAGWARLDGTVYVRGDLRVMPGSTIDLHGKTIYVEGWIDLQPGCIIHGPGCIIAEGNISFKPNIASGDAEFIFAMSIDGVSEVKPNGTLCGSVAGDAEVELYPGSTFAWVDPPGGLNFPDGSTGNLQIHTYNINP